MQSPKFPFRQSELRPLFTAGTIRRIWTRKVRQGMRRHYLPDPIDHLDFQLNLAAECAVLEASIFSGSYAPGHTRRILVEKSKGLCRQIVIPNVHDAIVCSVSPMRYTATYEEGNLRPKHFSNRKTIHFHVARRFLTYQNMAASELG